jgi:hypothetical protein
MIAKTRMVGVKPHQRIAIHHDLVAVCHDHAHVDMVE